MSSAFESLLPKRLAAQIDRFGMQAPAAEWFWMFRNATAPI
jgi:hypothetical protein